MDVALLEEATPDRLARAALEEHVVRDDDGAPAVHGEQGLHVLEEVELLVLGGGPEVLALVGHVFSLELAPAEPEPLP